MIVSLLNQPVFFINKTNTSVLKNKIEINLSFREYGYADNSNFEIVAFTELLFFLLQDYYQCKSLKLLQIGAKSINFTNYLA